MSTVVDLKGRSTTKLTIPCTMVTRVLFFLLIPLFCLPTILIKRPHMYNNH